MKEHIFVENDCIVFEKGNKEIQGASKTSKIVDGKPSFTLEESRKGFLQ